MLYIALQYHDYALHLLIYASIKKCEFFPYFKIIQHITTYYYDDTLYTSTLFSNL